MTTSPDDFVSLKVFPTPTIAAMMASLLESHGIRCVTPGADLKDAFASFQQVAGGLGCEIRVPASQLEAARAVLVEAKQAGEALEGEASEAEDSGDDVDPSSSR